MATGGEILWVMAGQPVRAHNRDSSRVSSGVAMRRDAKWEEIFTAFMRVVVAVEVARIEAIGEGYE